jgi:hypothetical protein
MLEKVKDRIGLGGLDGILVTSNDASAGRSVTRPPGGRASHNES